MAIYNGYNSGKTLFENADISVEVKHKNNVIGLNIDQDTENVNGGICSGITTAWLIMLINNNDEAREAKFEENFEITRFQGAYFKEIHGKAPDHIAAMNEALDSRLHEVGTQTERKVIKFRLPLFPIWGAYVVVWGHAIGIAQFNKAYYIMDPNFGLYKYNSRDSFLKDFQTIIDARAIKKNRGELDPATCIFFDRSTGL